MDNPKHPATYTDTFLPLFAKLLNQYGAQNVLDPMAGTGKIALVKEHGWDGYVVANELEPEWKNGYPVDEWHHGDAAAMNWAYGRRFDAIIVSPSYANRLADHHHAKDGSRRITYTHCLGRKLTPGNTGAMQWGDEYRMKHSAIWMECVALLKPQGLFVINVSNHIRNSQVIDVVGFHRDALASLRMHLDTQIDVSTPRMGFGANRHLRVPYESVLVFTKPRLA